MGFRHVLFTVVSTNSLRFRCGLLRENGARCDPGLLQKHASFGTRFVYREELSPIFYPIERFALLRSTTWVIEHGFKKETGNGITLHNNNMRPLSRGDVRLASNDPNDAPLIDPN